MPWNWSSEVTVLFLYFHTLLAAEVFEMLTVYCSKSGSTCRGHQKRQWLGKAQQLREKGKRVVPPERPAWQFSFRSTRTWDFAVAVHLPHFRRPASSSKQKHLKSSEHLWSILTPACRNRTVPSNRLAMSMGLKCLRPTCLQETLYGVAHLSVASYKLVSHGHLWLHGFQIITLRALKIQRRDALC